MLNGWNLLTEKPTCLLFKTQFSFYSSSMNGNCILHGVLEGEIKLISCSKEVKKKKKRANVLYIFKWFCIHKWFQSRRLKIPLWHVHFCLHIYIMMSWCNNLGSELIPKEYIQGRQCPIIPLLKYGAPATEVSPPWTSPVKVLSMGCSSPIRAGPFHGGHKSCQDPALAWGLLSMEPQVLQDPVPGQAFYGLLGSIKHLPALDVLHRL